MKNFLIVLLVFILTLSSCVKKDTQFVEEFFGNGKLKSRYQIDKGNRSSGLFEEYYESGKIKESGKIENGFKVGWWEEYDPSGFVKNRSEFLKINDSVYKNQTINFNVKGDTIYETSSFLKLYLPDTLKLGKNVGRIKYNSNFKAKDKYFFVLIDNQLSDKEIVKDTFNQESEITRFGVYAHKKGTKKVSGIILETILERRDVNKDSSELIVKEHKTYFEKNVYVK